MTIFEKLEAALIEFLDARERLSMVLCWAMEEQPSLEEGVIRADFEKLEAALIEFLDAVFNLGKE